MKSEDIEENPFSNTIVLKFILNINRNKYLVNN